MSDREHHKNQQLTTTKSVDGMAGRLARQHFSFLRGYLDGLDLRVLSRQYLASPEGSIEDLREVKSTLRWIRDEVIATARRAGRPAYARVLGIDPAGLKEARPATTPDGGSPTLDAFRAERDPDGDFYSEAELIALFREEYPPLSTSSTDRRPARNARLRARQNEALAWLEGLVHANPTPDDAVEAWLAPALSNRLQRGGIRTLAELIGTIHGRGQRWYASIPGIGANAAVRILRWLRTNESVLGCVVEPQALIKRRQLDVPELLARRGKSFGMVPLEQLQLPATLDGARGCNRARGGDEHLPADIDAIVSWLATCPSPHTRRSYRKEAERCLLWTVLERGLPLSSMRTEDFAAYCVFLTQLGTVTEEEWATSHRLSQGDWCGKRSTPRWSLEWRPFEQRPGPGPILSAASQHQARTVLRLMLAYLVRVGYLSANPWDDALLPKPVPARVRNEGEVTRAQWVRLMQTGARHAGDLPSLRAWLILRLVAALDLGFSELARLRVGDFVTLPGAETGRPVSACRVSSPGKRERLVLVPDCVYDDLVAYLRVRGFGDGRQAPQQAVLIAALEGTPPRIDGAVSGQALYKAVKQFVATTICALGSEGEAGKIAGLHCSGFRHWLRPNWAPSPVVIDVLEGQKAGEAEGLKVSRDMALRLRAIETFVRAD